MTYTPGPWKVQPGSGDSEYAFNVVAGEPGSVVLVANVAAEDHATRRANARLIASAPDLLAALGDTAATLETMLLEFGHLMQEGDREGRPKVLAAARAAIEKAS